MDSWMVVEKHPWLLRIVMRDCERSSWCWFLQPCAHRPRVVLEVKQGKALVVKSIRQGGHEADDHFSIICEGKHSGTQQQQDTLSTLLARPCATSADADKACFINMMFMIDVSCITVW